MPLAPRYKLTPIDWGRCEKNCIAALHNKNHHSFTSTFPSGITLAPLLHGLPLYLHFHTACISQHQFITTVQDIARFPPPLDLLCTFSALTSIQKMLQHHIKELQDLSNMFSVLKPGSLFPTFQAHFSNRDVLMMSSSLQLKKGLPTYQSILIHPPLANQ